MTMVTSASEEQIIWRNTIRKGIFHHYTVEIQQLSNQSVELIDEIKHITTRIPWSQISDVVVMNQRSVGSGYHQTIGTQDRPLFPYLGVMRIR
jgi:hypothetical protein